MHNNRSRTIVVPNDMLVNSLCAAAVAMGLGVHHVGGRRVSLDAQFHLSPKMWGGLINEVLDYVRETV